METNKKRVGLAIWWALLLVGAVVYESNGSLLGLIALSFYWLWWEDNAHEN